MRGRAGAAAGRAALLAALLAAAGLSGCSPLRHRLAGEEAGRATALFAGAAEVRYPIVASFTGYAEVRGRVLPLIAGVRSDGPRDETVGVYDPLGRAVLFVENDGERVTVSRGPAAGDFPPGDLRAIRAGPVSLGRILSGAPGFPVGGGETGRTAEGAWVLRDERQLLFTDPTRRLIARAEYGISGKRVVVTYPDRDAFGPPGRVEVELPGARISLRRDAE